MSVAAERLFVKDLNCNGKITNDDRKVLGTPYPTFTWGLTNKHIPLRRLRPERHD